jgi:hypothetical protein
LLVILLVVATLLVDLVVVSWVVATYPLAPADWPNAAVVALFALCMAQVGLVAVWTGFGGRSLPWRILGLVLTIGLWSRLVAWTLGSPGYVHWTRLLTAQSVAILLPLWAARLRGVRLARADSANPSLATASGPGPLQFSLRYLLSWITVLAIILGLAQYTVGFEELAAVPRFELWTIGLFSLSHGVLVLAAVWAVVGTRWLPVRALVAVVATAATIALNHLWTGIEELWPYSGLCMLQMLWVVASLSVFRVAGYRIVRRGRAGRDDQAGSADTA